MTQQKNEPKCPTCGREYPNEEADFYGGHREPAAPRDCDLRNGDVQCPARLAMGGGDFLFCRYVVGHSGKHRTNYEPGTEWTTSAAPPEGETMIEVSAEQAGHYKTVTGTEWKSKAVASPAMSAEQFYLQTDWHQSLGVAAKDMPPALIVTSRETAMEFAKAYAAALTAEKDAELEAHKLSLGDCWQKIGHLKAELARLRNQMRLIHTRLTALSGSAHLMKTQWEEYDGEFWYKEIGSLTLKARAALESTTPQGG